VRRLSERLALAALRLEQSRIGWNR
jgi:hypothetical protein